MDEGFLVRFIYGFSISFHNFFAGIPLGLAVIHLCFVLLQFKLPSPKISFHINSIFDLLVISILLAVISGFALELEFPRYWPDFYASLKILNHHIGHKSAIVSFFLSSLLVGATYYFRLWNYPVPYLLISVLWLLLAWLFSGWGIFVNTIMQYPNGAVMQNGILILQGSITDHFLSEYHLIRQAHIAAASVLKASIILLLVWGSFSKELLHSQFKALCITIFISLFALGITGHFQAVNISKHQPSKFAAMEGLLNQEDTSSWHLIGFMSSNENKISYSLGNILPRLTDAKLTPISEISPSNKPPVATVFNSFRLMIYSFFLLLLIVLFYWFNPKRITVPVFIVGFIFVELAINSGWILSESGRQPWTFFGLQRRELNHNVPYLISSLVVMIVNAVLLVFTTWIAIIFLKRNFVNGNVKEIK